MTWNRPEIRASPPQPGHLTLPGILAAGILLIGTAVAGVVQFAGLYGLSGGTADLVEVPLAGGLGIGLLLLKPWARTGALAYFSLYGLVYASGIRILECGMCMMVLVYLSMPHVRYAFASKYEHKDWHTFVQSLPMVPHALRRRFWKIS